MSEDVFRLPGSRTPLAAPEAYLKRVLRGFDVAAEAFGVSPAVLVARFAAEGEAPDYQIETLDGGQALTFSGVTHDPLFDDPSERLSASAAGPTHGFAEVGVWLAGLPGQDASRGPIGPGMDAHGVGSGQP